MNQLPDWLKIALPFVGSLLAVSVAALSAPVTANRFRLAKLDRLHAVLDKMDGDEPARPYVAAEARRHAAWCAATTTIRLSTVQVVTLIFAIWCTVSLIAVLIWPDRVVVPPAFFWWSKVWFLVIAVAVIMGIFRRRRVERVNFYNVLIEAGPAEFATMLRKRAFVPPIAWRRPERPVSPAPSFTRPNASEAGRMLEDEGILTCPNGHPVNGRSLLIRTDADVLRRPPPRNLVCARCLKPLLPPLTKDQVDKVLGAIRADLERKRNRRARRDAKKKKPTDQNPADGRASTDVAKGIEDAALP
jgi:hypothetical protein